ARVLEQVLRDTAPILVLESIRPCLDARPAVLGIGGMRRLRLCDVALAAEVLPTVASRPISVELRNGLYESATRATLACELGVLEHGPATSGRGDVEAGGSCEEDVRVLLY